MEDPSNTELQGTNVPAEGGGATTSCFVPQTDVVVVFGIVRHVPTGYVNLVHIESPHDFG
ncbi:MAG TPA: hypothetical protein VGU73_01840 [Acidimicrobiia bacterium]|nr:hypothetical protein [Acidimicrobiia bacterium]